jgi:hypothetical protein
MVHVVPLREVFQMLETILIVLVIAWALGFFAFHVSSGLIHVLLVVALVVLILRLVRGRR